MSHPDQPESRPPVIAVVGATATGKSDLAIALAQRLDGEVVNADASQLYRGMDIGTAKVPVAERHVPHHQLDVMDIHEEANVAAYQQDSRVDIADIQQRGRRPVLVGGSGLYVRAALDVLDIPPTDPTVRARWEAELEARGAYALYEELTRLDPVAAARMLPANGRRTVRALEVIELTGRPFSSSMPRREFLQPSVMIGLTAPRDELDQRITDRVERMWADGLLDEVRALEQRGLREGRTASRAIGYAQVLGQLDGELDEAQAKEATAAATRRLVRRQESWFRPDPRIVWLPYDAPDLVDRALSVVTTGEGPGLSATMAP
ncbi:tRNA (adenosine(37)-N6)-dimethylallyltransferase MiaA [Luteipulveratus mongoliensis]|uniref:tRNA dimethylallyltransferase n=1 Tax=Luteipulveratus mongoliensis TaxID=571913 RepID=A0A0K1JL37_9MICO|nr:tRNA (adenosine(37)-N6)-dimethylallyltransferase MiaA [Luteipulveratus mongoliensis]AKU17280.1 tRNA delta(2)-isopentenylpyrophosphate transferase [Luteipulveratus mongoliensis]